MGTTSDQISELLVDWSNGNQLAFEKLVPLVYLELRRLARFYIKNERNDISWQGSDLLHETYLRLKVQHTLRWQNRKQFFGFTASMMRRILVDHARRKYAIKRAGSNIKLPLDAVKDLPDGRNNVDMLVFDWALEKLAKLDQQQAQIMELRLFAGLSIEQTAAVLELSPATIKREWATACIWLKHSMNRGGGGPTCSLTKGTDTRSHRTAVIK